ncbi:hypothetical protein [Chitinophaga polysaccharea]|uniref:hypothetical protein n=1 Tax=Chitinophaga polysaccharea TaxID=1293035 RepID=UPI0011573A63|nr:hypothetical protein [Chitinophaga polysaccharea]
MNKLRSIIEPDVALAEERYPIVLQAIRDYTKLIDESGDESLDAYTKLTTILHELTGKDMAAYNLDEWWEEEGDEVLAFRISLPYPLKVPDFTKEELTEIVTRIKNPELPRGNEENITETFAIYLDQYYHKLLSLNFENYDIKQFQRNKDKSGKYYEYSVNEIVEMLWNK